MPEMEVVETPPASTPDSVKRGVRPGPSMADLRRKYLGADVAAAADEAEPASTDADEGDVKVKMVRPKDAPADPAVDPGPRAVIVSKKHGILGSQG